MSSEASWATLVSESLRFYEIGESALDDVVSHLMTGSNPTVAPYAESGEARLRISAKVIETERLGYECRPRKLLR
ncbi:hypothetical protein ACW7EJ_09280, partial [Acinetobacter soli]